jgi:hypothetical protein
MPQGEVSRAKDFRYFRSQRNELENNPGVGDDRANKGEPIAVSAVVGFFSQDCRRSQPYGMWMSLLILLIARTPRPGKRQGDGGSANQRDV